MRGIVFDFDEPYCDLAQATLTKNKFGGEERGHHEFGTRNSRCPLVLFNGQAGIDGWLARLKQQGLSVTEVK